MNDIVKKQIKKSSLALTNLVWPKVNDICGGGELSPVETVSDVDFVKTLDTMAGIDAWQIIREKSFMRGIASRVQWTDSPYESYTIRYLLSSGYKTEFQKRASALKNKDQGFLYPEITIQAYINDAGDKLLCAAVIKTYDLFRIAYRVDKEYRQNGTGINGCGVRENSHDGNRFIFIPWRSVPQANVLRFY